MACETDDDIVLTAVEEHLAMKTRHLTDVHAFLSDNFALNVTNFMDRNRNGAAIEALIDAAQMRNPDPEVEETGDQIYEEEEVNVVDNSDDAGDEAVNRFGNTDQGAEEPPAEKSSSPTTMWAAPIKTSRIVMVGAVLLAFVLGVFFRPQFTTNNTYNNVTVNMPRRPSAKQPPALDHRA